MELIETVVFYKFPRLSREELEAMLGLNDLKQTRVYQEGKLEGKLEAVAPLAARGFRVEEIAEILGLEAEQVRQALSHPPDSRSK